MGTCEGDCVNHNGTEGTNDVSVGAVDGTDDGTTCGPRVGNVDGGPVDDDDG